MESGLNNSQRANRSLVGFPTRPALCYTGDMSGVLEQQPDVERWAARLARWSRRLQAAHVRSLVGLLLDAFEPLSPLGAHALWIAQPTLGLIMPREDVAALARLLEDPDGVAWLRDRLVGTDDEIEPHGS
jgi:hypothetical protein